jgi:hypothetical protein
VLRLRCGDVWRWSVRAILILRPNERPSDRGLLRRVFAQSVRELSMTGGFPHRKFSVRVRRRLFPVKATEWNGGVQLPPFHQKFFGASRRAKARRRDGATIGSQSLDRDDRSSVRRWQARNRGCAQEVDPATPSLN